MGRAEDGREREAARGRGVRGARPCGVEGVRARRPLSLNPLTSPRLIHPIPPLHTGPRRRPRPRTRPGPGRPARLPPALHPRPAGCRLPGLPGRVGGRRGRGGRPRLRGGRGGRRWGVGWGRAARAAAGTAGAAIAGDVWGGGGDGVSERGGLVEKKTSTRHNTRSCSLSTFLTPHPARHSPPTPAPPATRPGPSGPGAPPRRAAGRPPRPPRPAPPRPRAPRRSAFSVRTPAPGRSAGRRLCVCVGVCGWVGVVCVRPGVRASGGARPG